VSLFLAAFRGANGVSDCGFGVLGAGTTGDVGCAGAVSGRGVPGQGRGVCGAGVCAGVVAARAGVEGARTGGRWLQCEIPSNVWQIEMDF